MFLRPDPSLPTVRCLSPVYFAAEAGHWQPGARAPLPEAQEEGMQLACSLSTTPDGRLCVQHGACMPEIAQALEEAHEAAWEAARTDNDAAAAAAAGENTPAARTAILMHPTLHPELLPASLRYDTAESWLLRGGWGQRHLADPTAAAARNGTLTCHSGASGLGTLVGAPANNPTHAT